MGTAVQLLGGRAALVDLRRGWSWSYGFAASFDNRPASKQRLSLAPCLSPRGVGEGDVAVVRDGERDLCQSLRWSDGGEWEEHENAAMALQHDDDGQEDYVPSSTVCLCMAKDL